MTVVFRVEERLREMSRDGGGEGEATSEARARDWSTRCRNRVCWGLGDVDGLALSLDACRGGVPPEANQRDSEDGWKYVRSGGMLGVKLDTDPEGWRPNVRLK